MSVINVKIQWRKSSPIRYEERFTKPVIKEINGTQYAVIPNFRYLLVSRMGQVIKAETYEDVRWTVPKDSETYITLCVYDEKRKKYITAFLHRLVAMAWIPNADWSQYTIVNHIDGNKHHPWVDNLEWTDYSGNANHAYQNGLRNEALLIRARDIFNDAIVEGYSMHDLADKLHASVSEICTYLKTDQKVPFSSRWELRIGDDETPWQLKPTDRLNDININEYTVQMDGKTYLYNSVRQIFNDWKVPFRPGYPKETYMKELEKALGCEIKLQKIRDLYYGCQTYELKTKKVREFKSAKAAALFHKIGKSTIKRLLKKGPDSVSHGIACRRTSNEPWPTQFKSNHKDQTGIAVIKDGVKTICSSIRDAEKKCGINAKAISRCLKTGMNYGEYEFKRL